jgi:hypothetical protein
VAGAASHRRPPQRPRTMKCSREGRPPHQHPLRLAPRLPRRRQRCNRFRRRLATPPPPAVTREGSPGRSDWLRWPRPGCTKWAAAAPTEAAPGRHSCRRTPSLCRATPVRARTLPRCSSRRRQGRAARCAVAAKAPGLHSRSSARSVSFARRGCTAVVASAYAFSHLFWGCLAVCMPRARFRPMPHKIPLLSRVYNQPCSRPPPPEAQLGSRLLRPAAAAAGPFAAHRRLGWRRRHRRGRHRWRQRSA